MGFFDRITRIFRKKERGTIFIKPSETGQVTPQRGGINVSIPQPSTPTVSGGRVSGSSSRTSGGGGVPTPSSTIKVGDIKEQLGSIEKLEPSIDEPRLSRKIEQQISSGQPSQIQVREDDKQGFVTTGFGAAAIVSGKTLFKKFFSPIGERPKIGDVLSPFELTQKPKFAEDVLIIDGKQFEGRKLTEFQKREAEKIGVTRTTFGELQTDIEKKRELEIKESRGIEQKRLSGELALLQKDIDIGSLTLGEAQTKGEVLTIEAQERFETSQKDIFKTTPDIQGIGQRRKSGVGMLVDLALFTNPLTSFVAGASSLQQDPIKIDVGQFDSGVSIAGATTQRPSLRTAVFLGGGLIGGAGELARSGRALTSADVEASLTRASLKQKGVRLPTEEGFVDVSVGRGVSGDVSVLQRQIIESRLVDGKVVSAGREQIEVVGKTFFAEKPFISGGTRDIVADLPLTFEVEGLKTSFGIGRAGVRERTSFDAILTKKGFVGEGRIFPEPKFEFEPFAGFAKKEKDIIVSFGGRLKKPILDFVETPTGIKAFEGVKVSFPKEAETTLQIFKPKLDKVVAKGRGRKTPFSTTFSQQQLEQVQTIIISPPKFKLPTAKVKTETMGTGLVGIQRAVGGEGLTEAQLIQGRGGLSPQLITEQQLVFPKIKEGLQQEFISPGLSKIETSFGFQPQKQIGIDILKPGVIEEVGQVPRIRQRELQKVRTSLVEEQLTKQKLVQDPILPPTRTHFEFIRGFDFVTPFVLPPINFLGGGGDIKVKKKRAKLKTPIRPSFTGIILGIEKAPTQFKFNGRDLGILPGQIRGLETGFKVTKKKVVKKKTKKKKK